MSETEATPTVRVYADYVCPFCHLGYASLDAYRDERDGPLSAEWHPFDLRGHKRRPDGSLDDSVDDGKDDEYYEEARENVRRLADEYDVELAEELRTDVDSMGKSLTVVLPRSSVVIADSRLAPCATYGLSRAWLS